MASRSARAAEIGTGAAAPPAAPWFVDAGATAGPAGLALGGTGAAGAGVEGLPSGIGGALVIHALRELANLILNYVFWTVLIRVLLSWVAPDPYSPVVRVIVQITEPIMAPVRKLLPPMGGFDLSPLFVLLGIQLLQILFQLR